MQQKAQQTDLHKFKVKSSSYFTICYTAGPHYFEATGMEVILKW